jgi:hypothetical protein
MYVYIHVCILYHVHVPNGVFNQSFCLLFQDLQSAALANQVKLPDNISQARVCMYVCIYVCMYVSMKTFKARLLRIRPCCPSLLVCMY